MQGEQNTTSYLFCISWHMYHSCVDEPWKYLANMHIILGRMYCIYTVTALWLAACFYSYWHIVTHPPSLCNALRLHYSQSMLNVTPFCGFIVSSLYCLPSPKTDAMWLNSTYKLLIQQVLYQVPAYLLILDPADKLDLSKHMLTFCLSNHMRDKVDLFPAYLFPQTAACPWPAPATLLHGEASGIGSACWIFFLYSTDPSPENCDPEPIYMERLLYKRPIGKSTMCNLGPFQCITKDFSICIFLIKVKV